MDKEQIDKLFKEKLHSFEPPQKSWEAIAKQLDAVDELKKGFQRRIRRIVFLATVTSISLTLWFTLPNQEIYLVNIAQKFQKNMPKVTAKISPKEKETLQISNKASVGSSQNRVVTTKKMTSLEAIQELQEQNDTTKPTTLIMLLDTTGYEKKTEQDEILENKPVIEAEAESEKVVVTVKLANPTTESEETTEKNATKQKTKFGKFLGAFNKMRQGKAYNSKDLQIFKTEKNNEQTKK